MTTERLRASEVVEEALRKIGVISRDDPAEAEDVAAGVRQLARMLKSWQNLGYSLGTAPDMSVAATTGASVQLLPRPVRVLDVRLKQADIETPMQRLTRDEYKSLPLKTSKGVPTCFYYDRQAATGWLYVWPTFAAVTSQTYELSVERETDDITDPTQYVDLPSEWFDAVVYSLADRLIPDYGSAANPDRAAYASQRASVLVAEALAADREGSVFFTCG